MAVAAIIIGFLVLDLGVLNRKGHVVSFKESLGWTAFWITLSLGFAGGIYYHMGQDKAVMYLTAYIVEQSLSVDNLFVFLLVFGSFKIPAHLQHRVLFWGIVGALIMRAICIGVGVVALQKFSWLVYVFGAILIYGGIKTAIGKEDDDELKEGIVIRAIRKVLPVTDDFDGQKFFTIRSAKLHATPLFLALVVVEISDVIFAVDSIPAVLAITTDPFIVYTSNVFAILGLRSIFFALAHMMRFFRYLKYALSVILILIGIKIAASHFYKVPVEYTLGTIFLLLGGAVLASVLIKEKAPASI
jgi:tellurite resistance protein TerC